VSIDHPWGDDTGVVCYDCGEVGHMARNCQYSTRAEPQEREKPGPTHCPKCGHRLPGHVPSCGQPPTTRLSEWVAMVKANLPVAMSSEGPRLYGEALARQQLADARAARLPEVAEVAEVADDDPFPF
jgi:hypothetical protein